MEQTTEVKKEKKPRVLTKKSLVIRKYTLLVSMYVGLFLPMFILGCVNFDKYFATNKDSFSVASGGILMAIFTVLLAKIGIKKMHKLISASFVVTIIWCLNSIISDFLVISIMFWIGIAIFSVIEIPCQYYCKLLDTWNDEEVRMYVRTKDKKREIEEDNYGEI